MFLNADLGESWKGNIIGNDLALMPLLDSCNIACGLHGGDALTMIRTIDLALANGVAIGAHPSFPDRQHFGRRHMDIPQRELEALLLYQVSALSGMVQSRGQQLHHIKPHGALYHHLNKSRADADMLMDVAKRLGISRVYGPPGGALQGAAAGAGIRFWSEGFADRRYDLSFSAEGGHRSSSPTLHLRSRQFADATIHETAESLEQVRRMITRKEVIAVDGKAYPIDVQTICIHGDHAGALATATAVRALIDGMK